MKNIVIEGLKSGRAQWVSSALEWVNRDAIDEASSRRTYSASVKPLRFVPVPAGVDPEHQPRRGARAGLS
jgi:hypothetical protein